MVVESPLTIVTAYYNIKSKFPSDNYIKWMSYFLKNVDKPLYIYTDEQSKQIIRDMRHKFMDKTIIEVLPIEKFLVSKYKWDKHHNIDPEKNIHTIPLYKIWNEKFNFVQKVIDKNPFNSKWFMWSDIGCFRCGTTFEYLQEKYIPKWPSMNKINNLPHKLTLIIIDKNFSNNPEYKLMDNGLTSNHITDKKTISGSQFIAPKDIFTKFHKRYYQLLDQYMKIDRFAGKDQSIMANMFMLYEGDIFSIESKQFFHLQKYLL